MPGPGGLKAGADRTLQFPRCARGCQTPRASAAGQPERRGSCTRGDPLFPYTTSTRFTMRRSTLLSALALSLGLAACSQDAPVGEAEPGGMGAGQPEGAGTPPKPVLEMANQPGHQDTTEAGSRSMQGSIRDSAQSMSRPQRPGTPPDTIDRSGEPARRRP